jgi:flavin-dependent dehydrogenase
VGDAAGFVDSLTGEGIYYAFRSAELLAGAIERGSPVDYERAWRTDFGADLAHAARMRRRFYDGRFLGRSYVDLSLRWLRASRASSCLSDALIAGQINYLRFTRSVAYRTPAVLLDLLRSRTGTRAKMRTYFCANPQGSRNGG